MSELQQCEMTNCPTFPQAVNQSYAEVSEEFGNLAEISQYVQPSELTRAERRLWLLESIRANMLCYAAEFEWRAMRGCSLPCDGIAPAFTMCKEMRDDALEEVDKIRATYDTNWVTNQLGTRPPQFGI